MDLETLCAVLTSIVLLGVLMAGGLLTMQDQRSYEPCFVRLNAFYCSQCESLYQAKSVEADCPHCSAKNELLRF